MFSKEDFEKVGIDTSKIRNGKGICPKCGSDRKNKRDPSLYVNYNDGVYKCFNHPCEFKGSVTYKKKEFQKKEYQKPIPRLQKVSDSVAKYFEDRKISNNTLLRFNITESLEFFASGKKKAICFNYMKDGKLVNIKFRTREKEFKLIGGAELCLYNIDVAKDEKELVIVEGEIDCMTCHECTIYNTVSVPNGAQGNNSRLEYIDNCWELLEPIEKFIIAVDDDEAGRSLKEALSFRLGIDKCWFITYPPNLVVPDEKAAGGFRKCKDLNEVHIYIGAEEVKKIIQSAEQLPIVGAFKILDVSDELWEIYNSGQTQGQTTQYRELDIAFKWKKKELNLWAGYGNYGKALALDTDIPTINGWKKMGDIIVGDVIFDEKGEPCNVIGVTDIMHNRKCYNVIFNDGTKVIADAEHLWFTHTINSRISEKNNAKINKNRTGLNNQQYKRVLPEVRTTEQIKDSLLYSTHDNRKPEPNHSIDLCYPVKYSQKNLLIPPYVLGCWLGDGESGGGRIVSNDIEIIENIESYGYETMKNKADFIYGIYGLHKQLRKSNLLHNKHIPKAYLFSSIEQRIELLQGLMDTDGYVDKLGGCEFSTIKKQLSEQVYELLTSLGLKARIYECDAKIDGRFISKCYRIAFKPNFNVFKLTRKFIKCTDKRKNNYRKIVCVEEIPSVPVKCISVDSPNKLYLCTKSYIVTHNTTFFLHLAIIKSMYDGWKWAIFSPENFPASDFFIDLIEMFVGKSVDERFGALNKMSAQEFAEAQEFIQDHIIYVYPPDIQNIEAVHTIFKKLHLKHGLDGVVIDPFNQLDDLFSGTSRDDQILSIMLKEMKRFALMNNLSYNIIAHPKNVMPDKDGKRPDVEVWHLAGGAMWNNKIDNILTVERPEWWQNKKSAWTKIKTHKIKRRRTGGTAGEEVDFDYLPRRSSFSIRGSDKMILDLKRAEDYRADKDFYLNELHRFETMGLRGNITYVDDSEMPVTKIKFDNGSDYQEMEEAPF